MIKPACDSIIAPFARVLTRALFGLLASVLLIPALTYAQQGQEDQKTDHQGMDHSMHQGMAQEMTQDQDQAMDHSMHQDMDQSMDHSMHEGMDHSMTMDATGMVMNQNLDKLPEDCSEISGEYEIKVSAGTDYAEPYAGTTFGFNEHQWQVEPCSRITVTFKNEDDVRHQWMIHKLPKYLYDQGMFHMEAAGGHTQKGTFIVPSDDRTYLVHCDIAQHMEKGMKAQLVVGKGSGDLWSIPGVSASFERAALGFSRWQLFVLCLIFILVSFATVRIVGSRK